MEAPGDQRRRRDDNDFDDEIVEIVVAEVYADGLAKESRRAHGEEPFEGYENTISSNNQTLSRSKSVANARTLSCRCCTAQRSYRRTGRYDSGSSNCSTRAFALGGRPGASLLGDKLQPRTAFRERMSKVFPKGD